MKRYVKRAEIPAAWKLYRRVLIILLALSLAGALVYGYRVLDSRFPNRLTIFVNEREELDFGFPANGEMEDVGVFGNGSTSEKERIHFDFSEPVSFQAGATGNYKLLVKLFGVIQLKEMEINVVERVKAMPVGKTIGIYVETDGIMVLGTGTVTGKDGVNYEPAMTAVRSGDYILSVNDVEVGTIEELGNEIQKLKGEAAVLEIRRKGERQKVTVTPVKAADGAYKLGIWTRENTQGIGTLTFVAEDGRFGALGHGITDADTGILMEIKEGSIYEAQILDIVKGTPGEPGEIVGMINLNKANKLGTIETNSEQGIFGFCHKDEAETYFKEPLEIGLKQEVKAGKAQILCNLGDGEKLYEIEIEKIQINSDNINKSMVIRITDKELLKKTNGIVQGMSGSPIIQNNKLIGAVTHVFVQDPMKGYGIFIESMFR